MADKVTKLQFNKKPSNTAGIVKALMAGRPAQAAADKLDVHYQADWNGARADLGKRSKYRTLCDIQDNGTLPPLFVHALAMPLHLAMFTQPTFPLQLLGVLHMSNSTESLRPIRADETLDIHSTIDGITQTDRGQSFEVLTTVSVKGETVLRETSSFLSPLPASARGKTAKPAGTPAAETAWGEPIATWKVAANAGRRFVGPSGDFNFIHISAITAKMFGFKKAIAHGMFSAAKCLAVLQKGQPEGPVKIDLRFKRPLFIPGSVALHTAVEGDSTRFLLKVMPKGEPHIEGRLSKI